MSSPLVSALVLNYRSPQDAVRCVRALQQQTIANEMEILLIDNHSEDDSIGVLHNHFSEDANVQTIETPENFGFARGNGYAERYAKGEYLFIINPDNVLQEDGLEKMISYLKEHPNVGIIAPKLSYPDGTVRESYRRYPHFWDIIIKRTFLTRFFRRTMDRYLMRDIDGSLTQEVDWLVGTCICMRQDLFEELQGFDPRFFLFFEDTDLCRRCWKLGKSIVYFPDVQALDRKGRMSEGGVWTLLTSKTGRVHIASAVKYFWKWRGT